ncbi:hypothetical protein [Lichenicoccus sp.]|uniref:hypothetical protein n=1 Tax=Lichenicoccus sp. TaxID=2781899 RepID=UPI003D0CE7C8
MFVVYGLLGYLVVTLAAAAVILRPGARRGEQQPADRHAAPPQACMAPLLHGTSLRGRPIRFYRSPLAGPDFPWVVLRDLFEMATDGAAYSVSSEWIYAARPETAQAVMTERGVELMLCFGAACALLATLATGPGGPAALRSFGESMAEAYVLQCAGLDRRQFLDLCAAAAARGPA